MVLNLIPTSLLDVWNLFLVTYPQTIMILLLLIDMCDSLVTVSILNISQYHCYCTIVTVTMEMLPHPDLF